MTDTSQSPSLTPLAGRLKALAEKARDTKAAFDAIRDPFGRSTEKPLADMHARGALRDLHEACSPDAILALCEAVEKMSTALQTIARREGRYSRDPLTHASNTIEDMARVAEDALAALPGEEAHG